MKIILFMIMGLNLIQAQILRDDVKYVILDTKTNLMWQDNATGKVAKWKIAIKRCEELTLAKYNDWRLPNINELESIVKREYSPFIVDGFKQIQFVRYWSSSSLVGTKAWYADFKDGHINNSVKKKYENQVRCVRDGQ